MQIVVQVHSLNLPYFPFFHKFLAFFNIQTFFYTIMNLFITLLENVNKLRTSANNVSLTDVTATGVNVRGRSLLNLYVFVVALICSVI
jgi:hypothetical protein